MNRVVKRILAFWVCLIAATMLFAGCAAKPEPEEQPEQSQIEDSSGENTEPEKQPEKEPEKQPEAAPEPEKETEYGSGRWIITAQGGPDNQYDELEFVDGELLYHTLESDEGKGTFGVGSPIENSRYYGMTVEEIVEQLEADGREVAVAAG